jgi:CcmD family protein
VTRLRVFGQRLLILVVVLLASVTAFAQDADGFKTLPAGQSLQEQLPATPLVFSAYAFVWVALLAYVFILFSRLKKVERELVDLRAKTRTTRA